MPDGILARVRLQYVPSWRKNRAGRHTQETLNIKGESFAESFRPLAPQYSRKMPPTGLISSQSPYMLLVVPVAHAA